MKRSNKVVAILAAVLFVTSTVRADYAVPDKAKALEALQTMVGEAAKSGKKVEVWMTLFGSLQKVELVGASAKFLTVKVAGNNFDQPWEKVTPEQIAGVGKSCVQGDAKRALVVADYCMATEQGKKADEALELAVQCDPKIATTLGDRWKVVKGLPGAPAAAAPAAAAAAPAASGDAPAPNRSALAAAGLSGNSNAGVGAPAAPDLTPYAGPAKLELKQSERGYPVSIRDVAALVDNAIERNLAEMGIRTAPIVDNVGFLRRASIDLTGQIPTPEEVIEFHGKGTSPDARAKKIEELVNRPEYADNMATFFNALLIGRRTRDDADVKSAMLRQWLREQFQKNKPYDQVVTELLTATGDNDKVGPANYLSYHLADTLPLTVGHLTQTFLGARIACAQCHDHPFDKWAQTDFWGFAAFLANTRSERREKRDDPNDPTRVTYAWHAVTDQNQRNGGGNYDPPQADLRLPPKALDGPVFTGKAVAKADLKGGLKGGDKGAGMGMGMDKGMDGKDAMAGKDMKKDMKDMKKDDKPGMMGMMGDTKGGANGEMGLQYRQAMAEWITGYENEKFCQSAVNRMWRNMFGIGLVEPVDDIRPKNPASHPEAMKILADDFNNSGRDMKRLVSIIANTRAYQRASNGTMDKIDRAKSVRYAARGEVRPLTPEQLLMAITKATGGEERAKALSQGLRARDTMMMGGSGDVGEDVNNYYQLMQRFISTSTAEDRAGKLQFEGTVGQALMMMHSGFMTDAIKRGVARFQKKGQGDMVYIFAACLGRPPQGPESGAFSSFSGGLEGIMWILLNSSEFMTNH